MTEPFDARDTAWMRRAMHLAARGHTPPNPMVGCVLVRNGAVVGEGYHTRAGAPHAEAEALAAAGANAAGATAYVTLEPCSHWGRTPPCSDALIRARIARVVAATTDVDARIPGKGLEQLRHAGIAVAAGLLEADARKLNEAFFHFHRTGSPFVTMKTAQTLDGKIATRTGDSKWITGARSRRVVHEMRARSGAVMVGIGTLLADDAELTARLPRTPALRQPLRIVVDSLLRTPPHSRAVAAATSEAPLLIVCTERASREAAQALARPGVEVIRTACDPGGHVDLRALMHELARREIISVLVEGGGTLNAAMLEAGLVNKALTFIALLLAGGVDARTAVEGAGVARMADAMRLRLQRVRQIGGDVMIEAYL